MRSVAWILLLAALWLSACTVPARIASSVEARNKNQLDWEIESKPGDPKPAKAAPTQ